MPAAAHTGTAHAGASGVSGLAVPCRAADPDLWFADSPGDLEQAKALCAECPIRRTCLSAALDRAEPWGVWGGEILDQGVVIARKRPRGRPRKDTGQQVA
ncbi:WhiB family transcriptional regulator [Rhodococcoides yunnanense]|uniref:WhiB family transcriptional regulator n=1 Tax=Rhodococcoides yunnanense TaxID=278209 RepID=UPI0035301955